MLIGVNAAGMYSNLKTYGYGVKELPQTLAVYFRLSDGFTVEEGEDGVSVFIGRENLDFYSDLVEKYAYKEIDRLAPDVFFENDEGKGFVIGATEDWCHWFRIYIINNDYQIEDFK